MEKIILLGNALNFKSEILDFATYIAKLQKSKLVGVFLDEHKLESVPSVKSIGGQLYVEEITLTGAARMDDENRVQKNMELFREGCLQREVSGTAHHHSGNLLRNIIRESRYADLLILDPSISFTDDKSIPSKFATEIISRAECPVLIAPECFQQPEEVVLAYNGSKSSVFAIKQFFYQLPALADKKITVLHINEGNVLNDHKEERAQFTEWLGLHFSKISFVDLEGDARDELFKYFMEHNEQNNKLLVMGAYGRSFLSSVLKPSAADLVLRAIDIPIFITHF